MNCKKGDLAIITKAQHDYAEYIGRVVTCAELDIKPEGVYWLLAEKHKDGRRVFCLDSNLRPIRDNPGKDETLDWCPVPTKETA
jgi:hypothetical protein